MRLIAFIIFLFSFHIESSDSKPTEPPGPSPAPGSGVVAMSECVKVIVRCRPLNDRELESNEDIVVSIDQIERQVIIRQTGIGNQMFPKDS